MSDDRQAAPGESSGSDPVDAIESALGALRGRGPGGPLGRGGPGFPGRGGPFGPGRGGWPPEPGSFDPGSLDPAPFGPDRFGGGPRHPGHEELGHGGPGHGHRGRGPGARGGLAALRLLAALDAHGSNSVSALAEHIGVDQPRASRLAQAAVAAGQVRREVDPTDARRSILVLTDAGRAALRATLTRRRAAVETALSGFTEAERAEFARLFTRFVEAWPR